MRILENTLKVNFIGLNKEKSNLWKSPSKKLISPLETPDSGIITIKVIKETPQTSKITTPNSKSIVRPLSSYPSIRFRPNSLKNLFREFSNSSKPLITTVLMWTFTDDTFYYNFIKNKDNRSAKRKVIFEQTLIT